MKRKRLNEAKLRGEIIADYSSGATFGQLMKRHKVDGPTLSNWLGIPEPSVEASPPIQMAEEGASVLKVILLMTDC
jgi:hypothetical protein